MKGASRLAAVAAIACLLAVRTTAGHNWLNGPSRAYISSVVHPCQARINPDPHVQVRVGQEFPVEWSHGHGTMNGKVFYKPNYFVTLRAEDYEQLRTTSEALYDEYLLEGKLRRDKGQLAAGEEYLELRSGRYARRFIAEASVVPGVVDSEGSPVELASEIQPGQAEWMDRDPVFIERSVVGKSRLKAGATRQWRHKPEAMAGDQRATYTNPKYPWIVSITKFVNSPFHMPNDVDASYFSIPSSQRPGDFIVHFHWLSYRDCIDVSAVAGTADVVNRFGRRANVPAQYQKIDHCEYTNVFKLATQCRVVQGGDASACLNECRAKKADNDNSGSNLSEIVQGKCSGVQAVRLTNPPGTLPKTPSVPTTMHDGTSPAFTYPRICDVRTIGNSATGAGADVKYVQAYGPGANKRFSCKCVSKATGETVAFNDGVYGYSSCEACDSSAAQQSIDLFGDPNCACDGHTFHDRAAGGCKLADPLCSAAQLAGAAPNSYLCYGFTPYRDQDIQAAEDYEVTDDITNPIFYSTCWVPIDSYKFDHQATDRAQPKLAKYLFAPGQNCVSCAFAKQVAELGPTIAPDWYPNLTTDCKHCEMIV